MYVKVLLTLAFLFASGSRAANDSRMFFKEVSDPDCVLAINKAVLELDLKRPGAPAESSNCEVILGNTSPMGYASVFCKDGNPKRTYGYEIIEPESEADMPQPCKAEAHIGSSEEPGTSPGAPGWG